MTLLGKNVVRRAQEKENKVKRVIEKAKGNIVRGKKKPRARTKDDF